MRKCKLEMQKIWLFNGSRAVKNKCFIYKLNLETLLSINQTIATVNTLLILFRIFICVLIFFWLGGCLGVNTHFFSRSLSRLLRVFAWMNRWASCIDCGAFARGLAIDHLLILRNQIKESTISCEDFKCQPDTWGSLNKLQFSTKNTFI